MVLTGQVLNFETKTKSLADDLSSARSLILFKTGRDFKILSRPGSIPGLTGQVLNVKTKTNRIAEL